MTDSAAVFAGVSALAAVVTASVASWALVQQQRDSRDRSRPIVIARFRVAPFGMATGYLFFSLANSGQSLAKNVLVSFDPELPESDEAQNAPPTVGGAWLRERYLSPLSVIAPSEVLNNVYASLQRPDGDGMPSHIRVSVAYEDARGRSYSDHFDLDTKVYQNETWGGPADDTGDRRLTQATEEIAWQLWRRGSN